MKVASVSRDVQAVARIDSLVAQERAHLLTVLEGLDAADWDTSSLCAGWTVKNVVTHVLMPYELSTPGFFARMIARRFRFDAVADMVATRDRRSPAELVEALRSTANRKFNVPGAPVEAPLSHLVAHSEDIYRPLNITRVAVPESLNTTLGQFTSPRASASQAPGLLDGVSLRASDTGWSWGDGPTATGAAASLISTLAGRPAALADLSGDGVVLLRDRLSGSPVRP